MSSDSEQIKRLAECISSEDQQNFLVDVLPFIPLETRLFLEYNSQLLRVPIVMFLSFFLPTVSVFSRSEILLERLTDYKVPTNLWFTYTHVGSTRTSTLIKLIERSVEVACEELELFYSDKQKEEAEFWTKVKQVFLLFNRNF
jgi:hypothetical protein